MPGYTGFPSPAEEHRRPALSLDSLLIRFPSSTFFARFSGDAMVGRGINDGDILVIERLTTYATGEIVMAFVEGERLVRVFERCAGAIILCPANNRYRVIETGEATEIFGRVVASVTVHLHIKSHLPVAN
jgi:DNA polymerase V